MRSFTPQTSLWMILTGLVLFSLLSAVMHHSAAAPMNSAADASGSRTTAGSSIKYFQYGGTTTSESIGRSFAKPRINIDFWPLENQADSTYYNATFPIKNIFVARYPASPYCDHPNPFELDEENRRCADTCKLAREDYTNRYVRKFRSEVKKVQLQEGTKLQGCVLSPAVQIEDKPMDHFASIIGQTCTWQCECTIFTTIELIRMPQRTRSHNSFELSPTQTKDYWQAAGYSRDGRLQCHVEDIFERFLSKVTTAESSIETPRDRELWTLLNSEYVPNEWKVDLKAVTIAERVISVQTVAELVLMLKRQCSCRRQYKRWHYYLPGYCIEGYLEHQPAISTNPPQDAAINNQPMCYWPPTMNPGDGSTIQPSGSAQLPTDPDHYSQSQHHAAAAGSSYELPELPQQLDDFIWLSDNGNFGPNDYGLPDNLLFDPMGYPPYFDQCPPNTGPFSIHYNYHDQCQVPPSHGESSWQAHTSQQYDHSANQHTQAQGDQYCDPNIPYLPALYDQDGRYIGPGNGPLI